MRLPIKLAGACILRLVEGRNEGLTVWWCLRYKSAACVGAVGSGVLRAHTYISPQIIVSIMVDRMQLSKMGGSVLGGAITTLAAGVSLTPATNT